MKPVDITKLPEVVNYTNVNEQFVAYYAFVFHI